MKRTEFIRLKIATAKECAHDIYIVANLLQLEPLRNRINVIEQALEMCEEVLDSLKDRGATETDTKDSEKNPDVKDP